MSRSVLKSSLAVLLCCGFVGALKGQTKEEGPWWPNPLWGAGDEAGGSNWITPKKVLESIRLVQRGQVYELGQLYERGMPLYGERTYAMLIPIQGPPMGENHLVSNDEFVCAEIGQVGTQFDGPGHIGQRLRMADGSTRNVFYNGFTMEDDMEGSYGLRKLGVENIGPFITRGILIDVAGSKGLEVLPASYEVSPADIESALRKQGMRSADLREGDALFFRYGWSRHWAQPAIYNTNPAGIGLAAAAWIIQHKASMVGSDSWTTEVVPNPEPELLFPVHQELIMKHGIFNVENMLFDELVKDGVYEFLFILTPLRYKGATGSPVRPIAVR